jgi:glycosyltransferase involved in cell wall biosynthesis
VPLAERIERLNLAAADRVVVVSSPLRASLIDLGLPAAKIIVNPNGVDPCQFRPELDGRGVRARWRLDGPPESVVVGFSGTFGLWHGIPSLAAAIPQVLAARPAVRFLLVGDGPLHHLVDGLGERVCCPGLVPHAEMPAYLAACDVLLSPHGQQADGGEFFGSPTKLFEYMAAGRPIVASAVGQIAEVLEHDRTALLVPPDDVPALVAAIVRLVDDAALRERLGTAARAQAVAQHTWRQNADRLLASLDQPA